VEKQIQLQFEPIEHKYFDSVSGEVYTSVTTVIGKYKEPFNRRYWSMYTALKNSGFKVRPTDDKKAIVVNNKFRSLDSLYKNPINTQEVNNLVNHWKDLTEIACARGNEIHDYLEDSINLSKDDEDGETNEVITPTLASNLSNTGLEVIIRTQHDLDKTDLKDNFPAIYNRLLAYINKGCILYAEKRIYTSKYLIAGMIDVLIVHLRTKQFAILDWKTNKDEMHFISGYYKKENVNGRWVKGSQYIPYKKNLFAPLNHLEDCKGIIYTLQLSLYAYIMELWGYKLVPNGLEIFHIRPNREPKLITINYKKEEVHNMLVHHSTNGDNKRNTNKGIFGIT
jgi:hypothetical protein